MPAFAANDGGGGGGEEGGGGEHGGGGEENNAVVGFAWVWFDRGGFTGSELTPAQGWDNPDYWMTSDYKHGLVAGRMDEIAGGAAGSGTAQPSASMSRGDPPDGTDTTAYNLFLRACVQALGNAKARAHSDKARIVGVGWSFYMTKQLTWSINSDYYMNGRRHFVDLLSDQFCWGSRDPANTSPVNYLPSGYHYVGFGNSRADGLASENGWDEKVEIPGRENQSWRDYIYDIGNQDNQGSNYVWVVVAVADGEPTPKLYPLEISKHVTGVIPAADANKKFAFRVSFFGEGAPAAQDFVLGDGEKHVIDKIPVGVTWSVEEEVPEGYSVTWVGNTGTIERKTNTASATNNAIPGSLKVLKRAEGGNASDVFGFHVRITESQNSDKVILEQDFTLKADQSKLFENLPRNAYYVVKETTGFEHYQPDWNGSDKGTIVSGETAQATCNNIGNGMFYVTKDLAD